MLVTTAMGATPTKRPNIILVMADDLGWGDVAYNGNAKVHTPVLDQLSCEVVRLDRFYAGAPVCTPTRSTCLTGRNPNRNGTEWAGNYPLPLKEITIAEMLRDAGYRTGYFGFFPHLVGGNRDQTGEDAATGW
ncbi:MAG: sulfatase-like hydrolase/transferase [Verrucomicrobia bacterium]|nr:sulfatase-like hydrolase/transferase [Verrucomicrobiota bacterium]